MATILSGSSRTALRYIFSHWRELIQVSLLPFVASMAVFATQSFMVGEIFFDFIAAESADGAEALDYGRFRAISFVFTLAGVVFGVWQFVRIVRLYLRNEVSWIGLTQPVINATLMSILYAIGIFLVFLLASAIAVLVCAIPLVVITGNSNVDTGTGVLVVLLGIVAFLLVLWVVCRFNVGLPAVALGDKPNFFKDLWGLSKGASWGYPLRMLGAILILLLAVLPISFVYVLFLRGFWPEATTNPASTTPAPELVRDIFQRAALAQVLLAVIMQPANWFFILLTVECYRRFKAARSGNSLAATPKPFAT